MTQPGTDAPRPSLLRLLLAPETLALDPEPPPRARGRGLARALLAPEVLEELPPAPPPPPRGRGLLRALLVPERLPEAPPEPLSGPPRPRAHWLSWLFRPESLDPPP